MEFEFLDLLNFGGVAFSVESVILCLQAQKVGKNKFELLNLVDFRGVAFSGRTCQNLSWCAFWRNTYNLVTHRILSHIESCKQIHVSCRLALLAFGLLLYVNVENTEKRAQYLQGSLPARRHPCQ